MTKIAIISDIHGNLEALNTVLDDIKKKMYKRNILSWRYNSQRSSFKRMY